MQVLGFLIGTKGATKLRLEEESGAQIRIIGSTRKVSEEDNVLVSGETEVVVQKGITAVRKAAAEALASSRLVIFLYGVIP